MTDLYRFSTLKHLRECQTDPIKMVKYPYFNVYYSPSFFTSNRLFYLLQKYVKDFIAVYYAVNYHEVSIKIGLYKYRLFCMLLKYYNKYDVIKKINKSCMIRNAIRIDDIARVYYTTRRDMYTKRRYDLQFFMRFSFATRSKST